ncbi:MAG: S8 family serine peptidase [Pyrinomonadaceae bacterium]|nr:S8 family serine peptidase [Pyrinomonadaceae bacterium]
MNRHNFLGHLTLALAVIMVAAFIGQMRSWEKERIARPAQTGSTIRLGDQAGAIQIDQSGEAEVLVRFKRGISEEQIETVVRGFDDIIEDEIEAVDGLAVISDADGLDAAEIDAYRALRIVEYIEPNFDINLVEPELGDDTDSEINDDFEVTEMIGRSGAAPNDPQFAEQWALNNTGQRNGKHKADIDALKAWGKTHGSDKVVVAVLDSGVDYTHPDLISNMWVRPDGLAPYVDAQLGEIDDLHGYNAAENNGDPMDDNGHGTHCAGIVGAEGDNGEGIAGVNWKVEIMPLKFMSAGGFGTTKDAIEAINYVIARKKAGVNVRVISASWGSTQRSRALEDVIRKAGEEGVLFVAASGNSNANTDRVPHFPSSYNLPNVISIAAMNRNDELASFSNYGPKSVHLAAPGVEILSTWLNGQYKEASGTSMATPVVSGVAALILSNENDLSVKELRERLLKSVDKIDRLQDKTVSGGRINAALAVKDN